jgi:hypothetical protein
MANRFPLIVDSSGTAAIKELASGDNLDLTGNGIVGVSTVALTNLTVGGSQGTDGQVLTSTGSGIAWEDAASGGGGGAWTVVSTTTVTSSVSGVEFTLPATYERYVIIWSGANFGTNNSFMTFQFTKNSETSYTNIKYLRNGYGSNGSSISVNQAMSGSSNTVYPQTVATVQSTNGHASGQMNIFNVAGQPTANGYSMSADDGGTHILGLTHFAVSLRDTPASSDKFGKIKLASAGNNVSAGTFTLYGLSAS